MSGDTLVVITREVLLISSERRPRMVLAILQCTGKHPPTKDYMDTKVYSADVGKPC